MELSHDIESHAFVLAKNFYIFEEDRDAWCDNFEYFFLEAGAVHQDDNYEYLWGFTRDMVDPVIGDWLVREGAEPLRLDYLVHRKIL